ncbi:Renalase, partial [Stegodyphus mimosarum]
MMLKEKLQQISIIILEKSKGTGGRMCTKRSPFGSSLDIGAQFITKTSDINHTHKRCYSELFQTGLLMPLQGTVEGLDVPSHSENYVCSSGSGSIVKHFLQLAGCEILFDHKVTRITNSHNKLKLLYDNNSSHEFDAVIFTIPVPQVLQLDGITSFIQNEELKKLKAVEYCSRFALSLFYKYNT